MENCIMDKQLCQKDSLFYQTAQDLLLSNFKLGNQEFLKRKYKKSKKHKILTRNYLRQKIFIKPEIIRLIQSSISFSDIYAYPINSFTKDLLYSNSNLNYFSLQKDNTFEFRKYCFNTQVSNKQNQMDENIKQHEINFDGFFSKSCKFSRLAKIYYSSEKPNHVEMLKLSQDKTNNIFENKFCTVSQYSFSEINHKTMITDIILLGSNTKYCGSLIAVFEDSKITETLATILHINSSNSCEALYLKVYKDKEQNLNIYNESIENCTNITADIHGYEEHENPVISFHGLECIRGKSEEILLFGKLFENILYPNAGIMQNVFKNCNCEIMTTKYCNIPNYGNKERYKQFNYIEQKNFHSADAFGRKNNEIIKYSNKKNFTLEFLKQFNPDNFACMSLPFVTCKPVNECSKCLQNEQTEINSEYYMNEFGSLVQTSVLKPNATMNFNVTDQKVPQQNEVLLENDNESLYHGVNEKKRKYPLESAFDWKHIESSYKSDEVEDISTERKENVQSILSLNICQKPLRVGLSKKIKVPSLHPYAKRK